MSPTHSAKSPDCLLISISALGLKTSLGKLKEVGWTPIVLMSIDTVFLLLWVIIGIFLIRG